MKKLIILLFVLISVSVNAADYGKRFAILVEKRPVSSQRYIFTSDFSGDNIKRLWKEGYDILSVRYTRLGWLYVYEKRKENLPQSYSYQPFKDIEKKTKEYYSSDKKLFLSSIGLGVAYSRWLWFALYEQHKDWSNPVVEMVSYKKLSKWAETHLQEGLRITSCSWKMGECAVAAHCGTDIDKQLVCVYEEPEAALSDIQQKWKEGWRVGIIECSMQNKYVVVYNTYLTPREGEQYVALCATKEDLNNFLESRTGNGYYISYVGGSFFSGPKDEEGNSVGLIEILSGVTNTIGNISTKSTDNAGTGLQQGSGSAGREDVGGNEVKKQREWLTCTVCLGSGKCRTCQGTGKSKAKDGKCHACKPVGSGKCAGCKGRGGYYSN